MSFWTFKHSLSLNYVFLHVLEEYAKNYFLHEIRLGYKQNSKKKFRSKNLKSEKLQSIFEGAFHFFLYIFFFEKKKKKINIKMV